MKKKNADLKVQLEAAISEREEKNASADASVSSPIPCKPSQPLMTEDDELRADGSEDKKASETNQDATTAPAENGDELEPNRLHRPRSSSNRNRRTRYKRTSGKRRQT